MTSTRPVTISITGNTAGLKTAVTDAAAQIKSLGTAGTTASQGVNQVKVTAMEAEAALRRMNLTDAQVKDGLTRMGFSAEQTAAALNNLAAASGTMATRTGAMVGHFSDANRGARRLELGLTAITLAAANMPGPIGQVVGGLVLMGLGRTVLLPLIVTLGALAVAYEFLTKQTREAAKEQKKFNEEADKAIEARQKKEHPSALALTGIATNNAEVARLQHEIALAQRGTAIADRSGDVHFVVDAGKVKSLQDDLAKATKRAKEFATQLGEGVAAEAKAGRDALIQAIEDELAAQKAGITQTAQLRKQAADIAGGTTFGALPGEGTAQEQEARRQKIAAARAVTAAEVAALNAQIAAELRIQGGSKDEQIARQARIVHLRETIKLRQNEGFLVVTQINDEFTLLQVTRRRHQEEEDHARRVGAARGGGNTTAGEGRGIPPATGLPGILQGTRQSGLVSGEGDALTKKFDDQKAAAKDLADEIKGDLTSALVDFVGTGMSQGNVFLNLLQALAQAAQQVASVLFQRVLMGAASGGSSVGNSTQSGGGARLSGSVGRVSAGTVSRSSLNLSGRVLVEAAQGTRATITDGEFLALAARHPKALRALGAG